MKKLLLFVLGVMVVCMGCSEEKEEGAYFDQKLDILFASKDSIHQYGIVEDYKTGSTFLCKENKKDGSDIWRILLTQPDPVVLDLGYGKTETYKYKVSSVIDTDENVLVYWDLHLGYNFIHKIYLGKYSLSGDFIENISIQLENSIFENNGRIVEMYDGNYLIMSLIYPIDSENPSIGIFTYLTIDSHTGIILDVYEETYDEKKLNFHMYPFIQFVNESIVAVYGGNNVLKIYDWNKKKQIGIDIESFVNQKYPNEERAPQYSTSHEVITETYADFTLHITFYNGAKVEHRLRFDYEAQEIIELML